MEIQKTAKTVSLAIDEALKELDTTIDNIEYTILQDASKGFLGIGSKPAKVLIRLKDKNNEKETKTVNIKEEPKNIEKEVIKSKRIEKRIPKMVSEDNFIKKETEVKSKEINQNAPSIAINFLKQVFEKMHVEISIDAKLDTKNNLLIDLKGKDIGVVIGKRGQTLDSLQYLTNLVVNKGEYAYMSVTIDTEDYREKRKQTLEQLAINLGKKAKKIRRNVSLEPMNPYERRIIHSALQNDPYVKTYSEGKEPFRYVVISPK